MYSLSKTSGMYKVNNIAIIFDVDGTLVDISESYAETVILTSYIYSEKILGIKNLPTISNWFTLDFYNDLKKLVGFNSDYVCTSVFVEFLLHQLDTTVIKVTTIPLMECSFSELNIESLSQLKERWITWLEKHYSDKISKPEEILQHSKFKELIKNSGPINKENYIERIFQEVYYGSDKFTQYYHLDPYYYKEKTGFYTKEKLLIPLFLLDDLKEQDIPLGIFTGRPRTDLKLLFEYYDLSKYFNEKYVITLTDMLAEEQKQHNIVKLSKPHPWGLKELQTRLGEKTNNILMIGDSPDDLLAAYNASIIPVHFNPKNKEKLQLGFTFKSLTKWDNLLDIINQYEKS